MPALVGLDAMDVCPTFKHYNVVQRTYEDTLASSGSGQEDGASLDFTQQLNKLLLRLNHVQVRDQNPFMTQQVSPFEDTGALDADEPAAAHWSDGGEDGGEDEHVGSTAGTLDDGAGLADRSLAQRIHASMVLQAKLSPQRGAAGARTPLSAAEDTPLPLVDNPEDAVTLTLVPGSDNLFSYFDRNTKRNWAGPAHWKVPAHIRCNAAAGSSARAHTNAHAPRTRSSTQGACARGAQEKARAGWQRHVLF